MNNIDTHELDDAISSLLPSQEAFIWAPQKESAIAGGFASGKTHAGCLKGVILSVHVKGNRGMVMRYHATDLWDTTVPVLLEVLPASWIKSFSKKNGIITLRNGSVIFLRHLHDSSSGSATKTRRLGANLGWFFIDQMEEIEEAHWNAMLSRLRYPGAPKKFGFGALNPNGHDWIYAKFFPDAREFEDEPDGKIGGKFYQAINAAKGVLGITVNSEENRKSNGGFVDDDYFDTMLRTYPAEWVARFIHSSFRDFAGKIFSEYRAGLHDPSYASVHNIEPFPIPKHWELIVAIDVGGDTNWAVVPEYVDEWGNTIVADGFTKSKVTIGEIAAWIKANLPWNENRTTFVIDWENKVAAIELAEHGIHCQIARKEVLPGITRQMGYFHVERGRPLPAWYVDTQPIERVNEFRAKGSPRTFVFSTFTQYRKEFDTVVWDERRKNQIKKTDVERFDTCDADRYAKMMRPMPTKTPATDKYAVMRKSDPLAAKEWESFDKRIALKLAKARGAYLGEVYNDSLTDTSQGKFEIA